MKNLTQTLSFEEFETLFPPIENFEEYEIVKIITTNGTFLFNKTNFSWNYDKLHNGCVVIKIGQSIFYKRQIISIVVKKIETKFSTLKPGDIFIFSEYPRYKKLFLGKRNGKYETFDLGEKRIFIFDPNIVNNDKLKKLNDSII